MLELYYDLFDEFYDVNEFEQLEMDTDWLYLAIAEENLYDCIQPEKKRYLGKMRENDCRESLKADAKSNFFPQTCCSIHKKHNKRDPGLLKRNLGAQKCYVYEAKLIAAMTTSQINSNSVVKI